LRDGNSGPKPLWIRRKKYSLKSWSGNKKLASLRRSKIEADTGLKIRGVTLPYVGMNMVSLGVREDEKEDLRWMDGLYARVE